MATKNPLHADHHLVPVWTYVRTLFALFFLMALTVWIAGIQLHDWWIFSGTILNQAAALLIAVTKAALVVSIFMGVWWSTQLTKFWALLGFTWLSFFTIMAGDYGTRKFEEVQGWEKSSEYALPRTVGATEGSGNQPPINEINVRPRQ